MISFITPINNRKIDRLEGLIYNIKTLYLGLDFEIIVAEQNSKEGFKLGQMRNLGFKKSKGDVIVFIDIDLRFKERIDFEDILKTTKKPFLAWKRIAQVKEDSLGDFKVICAAKKGFGEGGCIVFSRKQFEETCGNSNLLIGWGKEDHLLCRRYNARRIFPKIDNDMYHIMHPKARQSWGVDPKALDNNLKMQVSDHRRSRFDDGYKQTIANEKLIKKDGVVLHYLFSNIRVPDDFKYINLYKKAESFHLR